MFSSFSDLCLHYAPQYGNHGKYLTSYNEPSWKAYLLRKFYLPININESFYINAIEKLIYNKLEVESFTKDIQGRFCSTTAGMLYLALKELYPNAPYIKEVELHSFIAGELKKFNTTQEVLMTFDKENDLILGVIKTKNLEILNDGGILPVPKDVQNLFKNATTLEESCKAIELWLSWEPLIKRLKDRKKSLDTPAKIVWNEGDEGNITIDCKLTKDKASKLYNFLKSTFHNELEDSITNSSI